MHVIIGGKGSLEALVRARAQQNSRIHYLGHVPNREIPAWTVAADVVYYGFDENNPNARFSAPNKLFEALAAGRPLITGTSARFRRCSQRILRVGTPSLLARECRGSFDDAARQSPNFVG